LQRSDFARFRRACPRWQALESPRRGIDESESLRDGMMWQALEERASAQVRPRLRGVGSDCTREIEHGALVSRSGDKIPVCPGVRPRLSWVERQVLPWPPEYSLGDSAVPRSQSSVIVVGRERHDEHGEGIGLSARRRAQGMARRIATGTVQEIGRWRRFVGAERGVGALRGKAGLGSDVDSMPTTMARSRIAWRESSRLDSIDVRVRRNIAPMCPRPRRHSVWPTRCRRDQRTRPVVGGPSDSNGHGSRRPQDDGPEWPIGIGSSVGRDIGRRQVPEMGRTARVYIRNPG